MLSGHKKLLLVAFFTVLLIMIVNLVWWVFYTRTADLLDHQLGRRLTSVATTISHAITPDQAQLLSERDLDVYLEINDLLIEMCGADSLAELFILDENHRYLATSSLDADTVYLLSGINGPYIDSLFFSPQAATMVTPSYKTGDLYLKSAFTPLRNYEQVVVGALGVEANVDYFKALESLKQNVYYSSGVSILGGLIFGIIFLMLQRRLNSAEQSAFLNETHAHLGRMVAVVSHEIKNPLMIMRGSAERLKKKTEAPEADYIVEEIDCLDRIVSGYLDFAKGASGTEANLSSFISGHPLENIRLAELFMNLRNQLHDKFPKGKIEWVSDPVSDVLTILSYRQPLRQLLLNLLINGVESCQLSNKPIRVGATASVTDAGATIGVIDEGQGMKKREIASCFEPFRTNKQSGSGLGLFLSKKIVEELGGTIHIESVENIKTEVIITLPGSAE